MKKFFFLLSITLLFSTTHASDEIVSKDATAPSGITQAIVEPQYPLNSLGGLPVDCKKEIIRHATYTLGRIPAISKEFNTLSKQYKDHQLVLHCDHYIAYYKKYLCPDNPWTTTIIEGAKRYQELHKAVEGVASYLASNNEELRQVLQDHQKPIKRAEAIKALLNDPVNDFTQDEKELLQALIKTTKAIEDNFKFFIYKAKVRSWSWDILMAGTNAQVSQIAELYDYKITQNWLGKLENLRHSHHHNPYNHVIAAMGFVAFYFIAEQAFNSWRDERASYYSSINFVQEGLAHRVVGTSCSSICGSASINIPAGEMSLNQRSQYINDVIHLLSDSCAAFMNPLKEQVFNFVQSSISTPTGTVKTGILPEENLWLQTSSVATDTGSELNLNAYTYDPYCPAHPTIQTYRVMIHTAITLALLEYLISFLTNYIDFKFLSR